jgi:hypothetical protein
MNSFSEERKNVIIATLLGIIVGIVIGLVTTEVQEFWHSEPNFDISIGNPYKPIIMGNDSICVTIHNTHKSKKYEYPITLLAREIGNNGSITYLWQTTGDVTIDYGLPRVFSIKQKEKETACMKIITNKNAKGRHLIEFLAIGGDGRERICHLVLDQ